MNLISAENISKSYSEKKLLSKINLGINEGDKIGLIGINGTGKTTLLKIIAGVEKADEGGIIRGTSVRIEYLPQNPDFDPDATVLEQVFKGSSSVMNLIREYEAAIRSQDTSTEKISKLTHDMDVMNAWNLESEARTILTKLGCSDFNAKIGTLSGGQKKRIVLAAALVNPSDLLILDEPTNHLDNDAIDWLEQYLNKRKGALLMITHDIEAAMKIADRIAVFYAGTTVEVAPIEDFKNDGEALRHPYTKALWKALPENDFTPIPGFQPTPADLPSGCLFEPRCQLKTAECGAVKPAMAELRGGQVRCIHAT